MGMFDTQQIFKTTYFGQKVNLSGVDQMVSHQKMQKLLVASQLLRLFVQAGD